MWRFVSKLREKRHERRSVRVRWEFRRFAVRFDRFPRPTDFVRRLVAMKKLKRRAFRFSRVRFPDRIRWPEGFHWFRPNWAIRFLSTTLFLWAESNRNLSFLRSAIRSEINKVQWLRIFSTIEPNNFLREKIRVAKSFLSNRNSTETCKNELKFRPKISSSEFEENFLTSENVFRDSTDQKVFERSAMLILASKQIKEVRTITIYMRIRASE